MPELSPNETQNSPAPDGRSIEIAAIGNALHELLTLVCREDEKPRKGVQPMWFRDIVEEIEDLPVSEIIAEPIRGAAVHAIRMLGKRLHKLTDSTDDMARVAEEVAGRDDENYYHRINILDKRWDGIGDWVA